MTIIIATKDNKAYYGNAEKIAKLIGMTGEGLRVNIRKGDVQLMAKNGYIVYLNAEKVK